MQPDDFTVHIVDDEEALRKSLGFMLTVNGFGVRLHVSATAFSEIAPSLRNAVLVTDMRMPDMSGLDLVRKISSISPPITLDHRHGAWRYSHGCRSDEGGCRGLYREAV